MADFISHWYYWSYKPNILLDLPYQKVVSMSEIDLWAVAGWSTFSLGKWVEDMRTIAKVYRLCVTYPGKYYPALDDRLEKLVGRHADGSGMTLFGNRERDCSWYFKTFREAEKIGKKIKKWKEIIDVEVSQEDEE